MAELNSNDKPDITGQDWQWQAIPITPEQIRAAMLHADWVRKTKQAFGEDIIDGTYRVVPNEDQQEVKV